jgi:signal transduction histidine kinase
MRQPLSSIIGFTELLQSKPETRADQVRLERFLGNIQTSAQHLMALVNSVLDLAAIEARRMELHLTEVDVSELLASVGEMLQPDAATEGITIQVTSDGQLTLSADPVRLRQIVLNLAGNAIKFTPAGGEVSITAAQTPGEGVEIAVADNGIGIAAEDQARVFEAFTQVEQATARKAGGAGLGLALVKQLTELHGGTVDLESSLGRGTTIRVRLPSSPSSSRYHGVDG